MCARALIQMGDNRKHSLGVRVNLPSMTCSSSLAVGAPKAPGGHQRSSC